MNVIESQQGTATRERLWSHTIGILNLALTQSGTDPITGLPGTEKGAPGTGVAAVWGKHHFVLTAGHVLERAVVSDLEFFVRGVGELKSQHASEVRLDQAVLPVPIKTRDSQIHHCSWEDLAVLTLASDALGPMLEFYDITRSAVDPAEGEMIAGVGYPISNSVILEEKRVGNVMEKAVVLSPTPFAERVLPKPSEDAMKFTFTKFDPDQHYLIPYAPAKEGKHPKGISGAAAWVASSGSASVWAPRFDFAGTCTGCYKHGSVVQIVKASVVREFLTEIFGLSRIEQ